MTITELEHAGERRIRRKTWNINSYVRLEMIWVVVFGTLGPNGEYGRVRVLRCQLPKDDQWEPYHGVVNEDF